MIGASSLPDPDPDPGPNGSHSPPLALHTPKQYLDVNAVWGASLRSSKPFKHSNLMWRGAAKVAFFPLFRTWWVVERSQGRLYSVGCALYYLQVLCIASLLTGGLPGCEYYSGDAELKQSVASPVLLQTQVFLPCLLLLACAIGYGFVVSAGEHEALIPGQGRGSKIGASHNQLSTDMEEESDSECEPGMDSEEEEEEYDDDDEDDGGWGKLAMDVKVTVWQRSGASSKTHMDVSQLRSAILGQATACKQKKSYKLGAPALALFTAALPAGYDLRSLYKLHPTFRFHHLALPQGFGDQSFAGSICYLSTATSSLINLASCALLAHALFQRLAQTELTYHRRYKYAKYFNALTSSQRARHYHLPHFSLKNVNNIRAWLALRAGKAWLRKHGVEREADAMVTATFFLTLLLATAMVIELVSKSEEDGRFALTTLLQWELVSWCGAVSFYLLRFMVLGSRINERYRDTSVLLTEQINVQLRLLQNSSSSNPNKDKRERLVVSNNVLKLASKLLKEMDSPSKISGLSMNPVLYNGAKVILVSAISAILTEALGFKLNLRTLLKYR